VILRSVISVEFLHIIKIMCKVQYCFVFLIRENHNITKGVVA